MPLRCRPTCNGEKKGKRECVLRRRNDQFRLSFLFFYFSPERFPAAVIATAAPLTAFGRRRRALSATPFPASSDLPFYPLQLTPPTQFLPPANLSNGSSVYGTTTTITSTTTAATILVSSFNALRFLSLLLLQIPCFPFLPCLTFIW